jgi:hypothetical protein
MDRTGLLILVTSVTRTETPRFVALSGVDALATEAVLGRPGCFALRRESSDEIFR